MIYFETTIKMQIILGSVVLLLDPGAGNGMIACLRFNILGLVCSGWIVPSLSPPLPAQPT